MKAWSIAAKTYGLIFTLSAVAIGVSGNLGYQLVKTHALDKQQALERSVSGTVDKISRNLFERYGDVQAFAMSESARSLDPARIESFMTDMIGAYAPVYDVMMALDLEGRVIAVNPVDKSGKALSPAEWRGFSFRDTDWFRAAISGEVKTGQAHVTDLRLDPMVTKYTGASGRVMMFTTPIRDGETGRIIGVWTNRMSWPDVVGDILRVESEKLRNESMPVIRASIASADGIILADADDSKILSATSESAKFFKASGVKIGSSIVDEVPGIEGPAIQALAVDEGFASYPGMGWVVSLHAPQTDAIARTSTTVATVGGAVMLFIAIGAFFVIRRVMGRLEAIVAGVGDGAAHVDQMAASMGDAAGVLNESVARQAAALQQTAASIDEISAMIQKSSQNAAQSKEIADQSVGIAKEGRDSVRRMGTAIQEIDASNERILKQVEENNQRLREVSEVISRIGQKTAVINDIVFKTQLLSFNASVEAARAGEHGKGFAVVAAEVGNLATVSGTAAKEISDLLEESTATVQTLVEETKRNVEVLIQEGRQKVATGVSLAGECGQILSKVVENVDTLGSMVDEIAVAAKEQGLGVNEITKAMNSLDQSTNANSESASSARSFSAELSQESRSLTEIVASMEVIFWGERHRTATGGGTSAPPRGTAEIHHGNAQRRDQAA